ncbi:MAG: CDP-diacylglycerol--glycerol-3-phosphate 3-phosphatidyltransferase [Endomicrobiia bacterium]|nr:CDP-diacylglycerol--glycerol-3-phosphate 3-phosphatidyltransferase [Endomicrobiia bacterium]
MNIALQLTLLRLVILPFFVFLMYVNSFEARLGALILFLLGMLSDAWDGYFARKRNEITTLGTFLDPLADKLLISSALVSFVGLKELHIPSWMVVVIISREFLITGLRSLAASKQIIIPADKAGKFKTTSQTVVCIAILLILVARSYIKTRFSAATAWLDVLAPAPFTLMFLITILTFYSGARYLSKYKHLLK